MGKLTTSQKAARQERINGAIGKASGVMSGVSGILGSVMQNAQINDTSGFDDNIDNIRNTNFDAGDYDMLMSVYNPLALNNRITFEQIRGGSTAGRIGNVLSATANGAMTGATFGPWGALAGAATGLAAGIGGWIAGDSKAKSKVDELNAENHMASNEYINNFSANAERIGNNMFRNKILNIAAFGGLMPNKFAFGGLQPEYSNGATLIRNGGTHERNPYEGVQVGLDAQGVPNLVEEGEVIYDDYVYSNRLKPTKKQLESILLPTKYYGKTYAEIAKDIQSRSDEMPNDPIERAGLEDGMYKLRAIQDETKQREEQRRFMREFNKLSDDDKFALINGINQEAEAQQRQRLTEEQQLANIQNQQGASEYDNQPQPNQEAGIAAQMNQYGNAIGNYAYGGNLYPDGGDIKIVVPNELYKVSALRNAYNSYKGGTGVDLTELFNTTNTIKVPKEVLDEYGLNKSFNDYSEDDLNKLYELNDFYSYYMPDVTNGHINISDLRDAYNRYSSGNYSTQDEIDAAAVNGGRWYSSTEDNGLNKMLLPISGTDEYSGGNINPSVYTYEKPTYKLNPIVFPETSTGLPKSDEQEVLIEGLFDKYDKEREYWDRMGLPDIDRISDDKIAFMPKDSGIIPARKTWHVEAPVINADKTKKVDDALPTNYPTWLRYMPLATSAGAVIGDLFGLNKPDYSLWSNASKAANRINYVSPTPIGDYLTYNPYDANYMQGRINAQNAMAQRNILNTSSGNRGAAVSGILASQQQGLNNMSDMYRQALEYNDKQRQAVADFNRKTNQANAQMSLQAQAQNAQLDRQRVSDLIQLAAQKQNIRNASQEAIAGNITNLATLAGKYGKENVNINQLNKLINSDAVRIGGKTNRNGGKINRRRR